MGYTVIILDDHDRSAQATKREIAYWDPGAGCIITHTVDEARQAVDDFHNYPIGFVVVDLLLEQQQIQGLDFIRYLLDETNGLPTMPVLALSAHETMLDDVLRLRSRRVVIAKRSNDFHELQAVLRDMTRRAHAQLEAPMNSW